jgi:hypothetical protein
MLWGSYGLIETIVGSAVWVTSVGEGGGSGRGWSNILAIRKRVSTTDGSVGFVVVGSKQSGVAHSEVCPPSFLNTAAFPSLPCFSDQKTIQLHVWAPSML